MFTTFAVKHSPDSGPTKPSRSGGSAQGTRSRTKRTQVTRACDQCRHHRTRCDNNERCSFCRARGFACSNSAESVRNVEKLKARVEELEQKLADSRKAKPPTPTSISPSPSLTSSRPTTARPLSSPPSTIASNTPYSLSQTTSDGVGITQQFLNDNESPITVDKEEGHRDVWEGVTSLDPQTQTNQYYGSSSPYYFSARISSFLGSEAPRNPTSWLSRMNLNSESPAAKLEPMEELSKSQHDYFIGLFWQSHHCMIPILSERAFREHYDSLWCAGSPPDTPRKPSPLVDIVLALCMQYATKFSPKAANVSRCKGKHGPFDASIAGACYFRRCQKSLLCLLEAPSLMTVQCYLFSVLYLLNASSASLAYNILGLAVRVAQSLGLYRDPSPDLPRLDQELHRRIWWTLHYLDIKCGIELGRPWAVTHSQATCSLPTDRSEITSLMDARFSSPSFDVTWISYHVQTVKLYCAAQIVYDKLYNIKHATGESNLYNDTVALETFAHCLTEYMAPLKEWQAEVPNNLRVYRKGAAESSSFSADGTTLEIDHYAASWLQRQRLSLELHYHSIMIILYRPFICISRPNPTVRGTPLADMHAKGCLYHAITMTTIVLQITTETDIFDGCYDPYHFQWNATLALIGFMLAYPMCPETSGAREALDMAADVFDRMGTNHEAAVHAVAFTQDLRTKIDHLITQVNSSSSNPSHACTNSKDVSVVDTSIEIVTPMSTDADMGYIETLRSTPRLQQNDYTHESDVSLWSWTNGLDQDLLTGYESTLEDILGSMTEEQLLKPQGEILFGLG